MGSTMKLSVEEIEMWRIYLILIACLQAIVMVISSIAVLRYFRHSKKENNNKEDNNF